MPHGDELQTRRGAARCRTRGPRDRGPGRDRAAEQALLSGLTLPGKLGGALRAEPGAIGPAPTARLRGTDAAVFTDEVLPVLR